MRKLLPAYLAAATFLSSCASIPEETPTTVRPITESPSFQAFTNLLDERNSILLNPNLSLSDKLRDLVQVGLKVDELSSTRSPDITSTGTAIQQTRLGQIGINKYEIISTDSNHYLAPYIEELNIKTNEFLGLSLPLPNQIWLVDGLFERTNSAVDYAPFGDLLLIDSTTINEETVTLLAIAFATRGTSKKFPEEIEAGLYYEAGLSLIKGNQIPQEVRGEIVTAVNYLQLCGLTKNIITSKITDPQEFSENFLSSDNPAMQETGLFIQALEEDGFFERKELQQTTQACHAPFQYHVGT